MACIHTQMGKGGFWAMGLPAVKQLHRKLGKVIERAERDRQQAKRVRKSNKD